MIKLSLDARELRAPAGWWCREVKRPAPAPCWVCWWGKGAVPTALQQALQEGELE